MKSIIDENISLIVAIDPDVERNGVAILHPDTRALEISTLEFPQTLELLHSLSKSDKRICVVIEAGWLNQSNWHISLYDSKRKAAAKGNAVGRNHEVGRKIAEMCKYWGINHKLVKPLALKIGKQHLWSGKDGKITATELESFTGYNGRTNQEGRDAALLAWVTAGFNISTNKL